MKSSGSPGRRVVSVSAGGGVGKNVVNPSGSSDLSSVCNVVMTSIGLGVLTLPICMARCGWVIGILLVAVTAAFAFYPTDLLNRALHMDPVAPGIPIPTFERLAYIAYGRLGSIAVVLVLHSLLIGVCTVMFVLLGDCTYLLLGGLTAKWWRFVYGCICMPVTWVRSMKDIGFLSMLGVVSVFATCVMIVVASVAHRIETGSAEGAEVAPIMEYSEHTIAMESDLLEIVSSFCTFLLSYTVSITVPTIIKDMRNPHNFRKVSLIAFALVTILYLIISCFGYWAFGRSLVTNKKISTVVDAISPTSEDNDTLNGYAIATNSTVLVLIATHLFVLFAPTAQALDSIVEKMMIYKTEWQVTIGRSVSRSLLCMFCTMLAVFVPNAGNLIDLIGAVSVILIAVIFPIVFYWRILALNARSQSAFEYILQWFIVAVGVVAMGFGTYNAVKKLIKSFGSNS